MANHTEAIHHHHVRKRIHKKHEMYPHPDRWLNFLDKAIYFIGVFGPIMTVPQLVKIWVHKNAVGVSAISWSAYLVAACFWLLYGIGHKEKPIIVTYSLWIVLEVAIVVGTLKYG